MPADLARLEAMLRDVGFERAYRDDDPCRDLERTRRCRMELREFGDAFRHVELAYSPAIRVVEVRFVEIPDGRFHSIGIIRKMSENLEREFGSRLKLVYPRELPS